MSSLLDVFENHQRKIPEELSKEVYFIASIAGRTGSTLITFLLDEYFRKKYYHLLNQDYTNFFLNDTVDRHDYKIPLDKFILKTHKEEIFESFKDRGFTYINSIRNTWEQTISIIVAEKTNLWGNFSATDVLAEYSKLQPFKVDINQFVDRVEMIKETQRDFAEKIKLYDIKLYTIDYASIANDYDNFYKLLDLDFKLENIDSFPIKKTPIEYRDFIINYEELEEFKNL
jgi:hypothetical protein